jgi:pyruvate,water dikinase
MVEGGFPVPEGAILTTVFFAAWFDELQASPTWTRLIEGPSGEWAPLCDELKTRARTLSLTAAQHDALDAVLPQRLAPGDELRFAVRSSSPDEDLTSSSFAGLYETRLGVRREALEDAVRDCFASSLDVRVFTYKAARGFDLWSPRFAVVVQRQIDSEVAGVGFSVNPVTNDYDEAVIAANWGLGSSVVDGRVSPDYFVVNKFDRAVLEETRGDKRLSVGVDPAGGTLERENGRAAERTLTDAQLHELTDVICRIEALFEQPVDIEWAYAEGRLHLLQARPITTYVPLPAGMVTKPGERRLLYGDAALSKGLTSNAPISALGLDNMESLLSAVLESWVGPLKRHLSPKDALFFFTGARMYMNYSNMLWLASPAMLARSATATDALMAEIMAGIDANRYRADTRPAWVSVRLLWLVPRALWRLRRFFWNLLRTVLSPERAHRTYERKLAAFLGELREQLDDGLSLDEFRRTYETRMAREIFDVAMPALIAGAIPPAPVVRARDAEGRALANTLTMGATGNVVIEMGLALYRLATLLDRSDFDDLDRLAERVHNRQLPAAFLTTWDDFLSTFGWRGPMEMDVASPRYADDPHLALRQMSFMAVDDARFDPRAAHHRQVDARRHAYEQLLRKVGPVRRVFLRRVYRLIDLFAGTRDSPKHLVVLFNYAVRKRALAEGRRLTREGRLDAAEQVFDLTFEEIRAASRDATLDLRALCEERLHVRRTLAARVRAFPLVIDSRGRILRPPPREHAPDLLSGMPVSPGVVTGPVKVLHSPHEKRVDKGDVLVAYTTDPGWTPLFVNAAAIVLEVGGVLQHGAVVAREYGKPCVVGIDRVVETLHDGQTVEVNGTMGTVRRLRER